MNQETTEQTIWRLRPGNPGGPAPDLLVEESPVELVVSGEPGGTLMATPGLERELAAGFAVTMGWALPGAPPCETLWEPESSRAHLALEPSRVMLGGPKATGGGPLGPTSAPPVKGDYTMELETVLGLTRTLGKNQRLFDLTGASHAAALFDGRGELLVVAEDAGRHNALDKAVGALWLAGRLADAKAVAFSGRQSLEMVLKAARAGVAILVGVSAVTAPAARKAHEIGVTVCGFARKGGINLYTHPHRITREGKPLSLA